MRMASWVMPMMRRTSVRWLPSKRIDLALVATNLLDETDYRYTSFGSLSESLYTFNIRPRNIFIKMQIKI